MSTQTVDDEISADEYEAWPGNRVITQRAAAIKAARKIAGGFDACTREQQQQMLEWFMYRVKPDQRNALAATLPAAYNAWHGRAIVQVVSADDSTQVWADK